MITEAAQPLPSTWERAAVPPAPGPMVEVTGLRKRFGRLEVLKGIDVLIRAGRVTGIVGPNAAGKSTFIKVILGLIHPDGGTVRVAGRLLDGDVAYRRDIGYMPQAARFPENLTGAEVLAMLADLRGERSAINDGLLGRFGLAAQLHKPVRTLSGGTRQKLSAAIAFLFRPVLLILDEPTAGLDPVASGVFKDELGSTRSDGATVLLASHSLSELEELADDIVFLHEGQVRFQGPIHKLIECTGFARLERAIASLMTQGMGEGAP